ncbi:MAG: nitrous oxide reductase family maturation protein NosD [Bdellovibrionales bacterium]|jgi:nitrous oxidase accessory protein|nr:nitrous oxide reductase family maturation protein NosD [Bdellovibrionales bacterium]
MMVSKIVFGCFIFQITSFVFAKDIVVCASCDLKTPQEAYAVAKDGDRLLIKAGRYFVQNFTIDKSLDLIGEDLPIFDGQTPQTHIIQINKANVKIVGIHFKNAGNSTLNDLAAIYVNETEKCYIANNLIEDSFFGIYLAGSKSCTIIDNKILGPNRVEFESGNAIHIWKGEDMNIVNNETTGHRDGIYFEFVSDSRIVGNKSHHNQRYGLHFMFSNRNEFKKNHFTQNGSGVAVMYSKKILMEDNVFTDSWGPAAFGLLLKDISDSTISQNLINKNTVGIYMEGSNRSQLYENNLIDNGWAIRLMGNCDDNVFTHNNFKNNTFEASTNSSQNNNKFFQNYWSGYEGYDLDRDGLGDIPYRPVRLSSVMMEKFSFSFLLIKSLFLNIADKAESLFPSLTPETLQDEKPLMQEL